MRRSASIELIALGSERDTVLDCSQELNRIKSIDFHANAIDPPTLKAGSSCLRIMPLRRFVSKHAVALAACGQSEQAERFQLSHGPWGILDHTRPQVIRAMPDAIERVGLT